MAELINETAQYHLIRGRKVAIERHPLMTVLHITGRYGACGVVSVPAECFGLWLASGIGRTPQQAKIAAGCRSSR
jgi:hypothetical protein